MKTRIQPSVVLLALPTATLGALGFAIAWWLGLATASATLLLTPLLRPSVERAVLRWGHWWREREDNEPCVEIILFALLLIGFGCIWFVGLVPVYIAGWALTDMRFWFPLILVPLLAAGVSGKRNPPRSAMLAALAAAIGGAWAFTAILGNSQALFYPMLGYVVGGGAICLAVGIYSLVS